MPYEPLAIWLIDQWRQVGLTVKQEVIEAAAYYQVLRRASSRSPWTSSAATSSTPTWTCTSSSRRTRTQPTTAATWTASLDELFEKQGRAHDPEERKQFVRQFEKRLLDEEAHYLMTLQWHRIVPHSSKVKGWTITPSHYLNNSSTRSGCGVGR